jgi:hypothetical protein
MEAIDINNIRNSVKDRTSKCKKMCESQDGEFKKVFEKVRIRNCLKTLEIGVGRIQVENVQKFVQK